MTTAASIAFAPPRRNVALADCLFYHQMDLPGVGRVLGDWDLSHVRDRYLAGVPVAGQRVLELGPASGLLTWHLEQMGAEVVGFDAGDDTLIDMLIPGTWDARQAAADFRVTLEKLRNSFWFSHQALGLKANVAYGDIYHIPSALGPVDVTTAGCILLHLRDPFRALQQALRLTRHTVIVTETLQSRRLYWTSRLIHWLLRGGRRHRSAPLCMLQPGGAEVQDTYWGLPPDVMRQFLDVLGFRVTRTVFHVQRYKGAPCLLYTMVGERVRDGMQPLCD